MGIEHQPGQSELVEKIIKKNLCVKCGACVGLCPYLKFHDGKVVVMDACIATEGRCVKFCPMMPDLSGDPRVVYNPDISN